MRKYRINLHYLFQEHKPIVRIAGVTATQALVLVINPGIYQLISYSFCVKRKVLRH